MGAVSIIVIDDEIRSLQVFVGNVLDADIQCVYFSDCDKFLNYAREHKPDCAFLDINMPGKNGVDLAEEVTEASPDTKIVFISGYAQNEREISERIGANLLGFCYKPYSRDKIEWYITKIHESKQSRRVVTAKTFGAFDLAVNGENQEFPSQKSKEFLALLVARRGATVEMGETIAALWPDKETDKAKMLYRNAKCRLELFLRERGLGALVAFGRGRASVNCSALECDMWRYLDDERDESYKGEFLINYDWSLTTQLWLDEVADRRKKQ